MFTEILDLVENYKLYHILKGENEILTKILVSNKFIW